MKRAIFSLAVALLISPVWAAAVPATVATLPERPNAALEARVSSLMMLAFDQPEAALQALRELAAQPEARGQADLLRYAQARALIEQGELPAAQLIADELGRQAATHAKSLLLRAFIADRSGQTTQATSLARQALAELEVSCPPGKELESIQHGCAFRGAWHALAMLARDAMARGEYIAASTTVRRGMALAEAGGDRGLLAVSQVMLAWLGEPLKDPAQAAHWMALALETARGDELAVLQVKVYEPSILWEHDPERQRQRMEDVIRLAQRLGAVRRVAQMQIALIDYYLRKHQPAQALALAQQALPVLLRFKDQRLERYLRHNMSVAQIEAHQFEAARQSMLRVQALRRGQDDLATRANEMRELGTAWEAAGQLQDAIQAFHSEHELQQQLNANNRDSALEMLKSKYRSQSRQRDLELLQSEKTLKDQQLRNLHLAQQVGLSLVVLLGLASLLVWIMLRRMREAQRRLKANQLLLRAQSERDPLTDLANRRHFLSVMAEHAQEDFSGALLMVDIDHFKRINDEHGHLAGDVVICEAAQRLAKAVRTEDLVVRWGGEEFLVYAPGVNAEQLAQLAERILLSLGQAAVELESGPLHITASIGFAHFPLPHTGVQLHWEQAVNWADMALYMAKAQGRNRAIGVASVQASDRADLLDIEADFDAACTAGRVTLLQVLGPQR